MGVLIFEFGDGFSRHSVSRSISISLYVNAMRLLDTHLLPPTTDFR